MMSSYSYIHHQKDVNRIFPQIRNLQLGPDLPQTYAILHFRIPCKNLLETLQYSRAQLVDKSDRRQIYAILYLRNHYQDFLKVCSMTEHEYVDQKDISEISQKNVCMYVGR